MLPSASAGTGRPGDDDAVEYGRVPLADVANAERTFPAEWIADSRTDVTDGFVRWATPLLGGPLAEFAEIKPTAPSVKTPPRLRPGMLDSGPGEGVTYGHCVCRFRAKGNRRRIRSSMQKEGHGVF